MELLYIGCRRFVCCKPGLSEPKFRVIRQNDHNYSWWFGAVVASFVAWTKLLYTLSLVSTDMGENTISVCNQAN